MKAMFAKKILAGVDCLVADCVDAETWMSKQKLGQQVFIDPRRKRNPQHHRKFFAVINLAKNNWPEQEDGSTISTEALVSLVKLKTGHVNMIKAPDGEIYMTPKSIDYASMSQDAFEPFYKDAMAYLASVLGVDPETLNSEAYNQ